ncbi:MAG: aminoacyl-tRNA hydrolase [Oscillospiraceae bacterium]|nr:aminoacyl-tRNA hydrolase [Oscillospiraceae bacterium]
MYLIVGLGNPEKKYGNTRHNIGFKVINKISEDFDIKVAHSKFKSEYGMGEILGEKIILVKPQTYMNLSGEAIIQFKKFYKIENSKIIVIYDDIDVEPGDIRIRKNGGSGTHNGMRSVIEHLKTEEFARVRLGIGKPEYKDDITNYVIGPIPKREIDILNESISRSSEAVAEILKNGIDSAMNKFN